MKLLKRTLCIFLSVLILFLGVSNSYFSPHKMDESHAMGATYMTYETMQAICYYLGSLFLGYSASAEVPDLTDDQIMQLGHAYIKSLYDVSGVNPFISDQLADTTQTLFALISNKQAYVFGSEALKEVAETEFTVIMGGGNDDDDNEDDEENNEASIKINVGNAIDCLGALSLAGVSLFEDSMQYWMDLFSKGEPNIIDDTLFAEILPQHVYSDDVWKIISTNEEFHYQGAFSYEYDYIHPYYESYNYHAYFNYTCDFVSTDRVCCYTQTEVDENMCSSYRISFYGKIGSKAWDFYKVPVSYIKLDNSSGKISTGSTAMTGASATESTGETGTHNILSSWSFNIPVFNNVEDAQNFANTGQGIEKALNYINPYRIADWLQDDWSGELVDPLTGLSYLDDLAGLANQQGLNGLGDNPDLSDVNDYLRDKLQDINQQYNPDTNPIVDPALDPIPYPSTLPVPVIDPTSPVVIQPVADPDPAPSTDPDPQPSTDPVVDPVTDPVPLPENVPDGLEDIADNVPAVADSLADIGGTLKTKFPFSIPWDIYYILNGLATTPKAPYFELPLKVERYGIDETIIVDMSRFQVLSDLSRSIFSMLFMIVLINLTIKVIGSIKEES